MHTHPCPDLWAVARALRPASLVLEAERKAAADIEFLTGKLPIDQHYEDVPLLCEVPRAELRERQLLDPRRGPGNGETAGDPAHSAVAILTYEERLHQSGFTSDRKPVDWRDLFSKFSTL